MKKKFFPIILITLCFVGLFYVDFLKVKYPISGKPDLLESNIPFNRNKAVGAIDNEYINSIDFINKITLYGDNFLVGGFYENPSAEDDDQFRDYDIKLVDIYSGKLVKEKTIKACKDSYMQSVGDKIIVSDPSAGIINILNGNLKLIGEWKTNFDWTACYVDSEGRNAYFQTNPSGIRKVSLEDGSEENLLKGMANIQIENCYFNGKMLPVSFIDSKSFRECHGCIEMATGNYIPSPYTNISSSSYCIDNTWLSNVRGTKGKGILSCNGKEYVLKQKDAAFCLINGPAPIATTNNFDAVGDTVSFYKEDGTFFASTSINDGITVKQVLWCPQREVFLINAKNEDEYTQIYYLDPAKSDKGKNLKLKEYKENRIEPGEKVSAYLYNRAADISKRYGVQILIAEQCENKYKGYTAKLDYDEDDIEYGLDELEKALSSYPSNFISQLLYGDFNKIEINLVGEIAYTEHSMEEYKNGHPLAALLNQENCKHILAMDINRKNMEMTLYHEFSHIIDERLEFVAMYLDTIFSEERWMEYNPKDFQYAGNMGSLPEDYYNDGYEGYFIDSYARTDATEDRARIMEYAMMNYDRAFNPRDCRPLRDKLALYSAAIRQSFDTTGWPATTQWEKPLNGYRYTKDFH